MSAADATPAASAARASGGALPERARVVIIGGGVIGVSAAYHLADGGAGDVVLLERKELGCGTTWHAAGLVAQLRASESMTMLSKYSAALYRRLEDETGESTGYRQKGALNLAANEGLMQEYRRAASLAARFGLPAQMLAPEQIAEHCPLVNTEGLQGALLLPTDGQIDPVGLTRALAKGARAKGAVICENTKALRVLVKNGRVTGARTAQGDIAADAVVLAAGMWTRDLAADIGATVPLQACEHYYIVTEAIEGVPANTPTVRDVEARAYFKEDAGKILVGCFEERARVWGEGGIPEDFSFDALPGDFDHFAPVLEKAMHRLPVLRTAGVRLFFCGPESFTPDDVYFMGEAPEARGLYVAAGMNSIGIQSAGGVGWALARWIRDGIAPRDLGRMDIARAMPFQRNRRYLQTRARESLGVLYEVHWPHKQMTTARGARQSPLHDALRARGACFGEAAGWERANWFLPGGKDPEYEYSFGRQNWFAHCGDECRAAQNAAGIVDLSSFAKYIVRGADACRLLNRVCAGDADIDIGRVLYTPWLNARGGFEADLTVTRLAENEYLILSGVMSQTRDMAWLRRHRRDDERAEVFDATSSYANIGVFGPKAAAVLRAAGADDISEAAIPYGAARRIETGYALPLALRLGYAGEAGFELVVESEFAAGVYRALREAGEAHGMRDIGFHAVDSMRMEKARRHFGDDITGEDTPLEAGLAFALAWDKAGGFIGRDALLRQRGEKRTKRLLQFRLAAGADAPLMFGEEPLLRDGEIVGGVTSAAYGHRVGASLALAYARADGAAGGADNAWCAAGAWQIEIAGERHAAEWCPRPPYDPQNTALKLD